MEIQNREYYKHYKVQPEFQTIKHLTTGNKEIETTLAYYPARMMFHITLQDSTKVIASFDSLEEAITNRRRFNAEYWEVFGPIGKYCIIWFGAQCKDCKTIISDPSRIRNYLHTGNQCDICLNDEFDSLPG